MSSDDYYDLNEDSKVEQLRHAELLRKYEAQKRGRGIALPTSIEDVKARLRELNQPATLFGEDHADRRERLREVIGQMELGQEELLKLQEIINQNISSQSSAPSVSHTTASKAPESDKVSAQKEVFYSPATEAMVAARKLIAAKSFRASHERVLKERKFFEDENLQAELDDKLREIFLISKEMTLNSTQIGDERPLTSIRCASQGEFAACGSLSGTVKIWNTSTFSCLDVLKRHSDRVTAVAWSGRPWDEDSSKKILIASTSADGVCNIWNSSAACGAVDTAEGEDGDGGDYYGMPQEEMVVEENGGSNQESKVGNSSTLLHQLKGHHGIVTSCDFHPHGSLIGTSGGDYSWRLWDIETGSEILLQDGHVKECSAISFHGDGSLVATGDSSGVGLLWDLRSGQCILPLQGHTKKITSAQFSPNGYQLCTSSVDNTVRIWDLRKRKCGYTLPAHSNIITDARYSKSGELIATASFDGTIKIWCSRDYQILRTLAGHLGKVMSCDFSQDEKHILSAGYDKTVKLWAHKDEF